MGSKTIALAAIPYGVFLHSLTCHGGSHAVLAKELGGPAACEAAQVALNPIPHMRCEQRGRVVAFAVVSFLSGFKVHFDPLPSSRSYGNIDATCS